MNINTQVYKCCMCGDPGLSSELFRCKVCHFRSQHRYCSNLYPKAETYNVCNWCIIQKDDDNHTTTTTTIISNNSSSNSSSPSEKHTTKTIQAGPKPGPGPRPKGLQPISPIKKPKPMAQSPEARSPSGRKRITAVHSPSQQAQVQAQAQARARDEKLRRTKSSIEMSNNYSTNSGGGGGPPVVKHVFRNKVRRYKLLDEVSG
ncbi:hypothetical protein RND81_06G060900 [Saponaria officinalis]|uniref:PHD-type zinc finger plants domain-containing protein n=1 Tax=Saponaria officinalis TaxID=3572 RepID=A0AAW1K8J6_SAPOF